MKNKAKFSSKVKEEIALRDDSQCIICGNPGQTIHHAYYGMQSNRGPNRNDVDQGCCLCYDCHHNLHNGEGKDLRQACIYYLKGL